jgi:hypothetical protein
VTQRQVYAVDDDGVRIAPGGGPPIWSENDELAQGHTRLVDHEDSISVSRDARVRIAEIFILTELGELVRRKFLLLFEVGGPAPLDLHVRRNGQR